MSTRKHKYANNIRVSEDALLFDAEWIAAQTAATENALFHEEQTNHPTRLQLALRGAWKQDLTEIQRKYFSSYYVEKLSMKQIAAKHGVSESTVSRTITRARRNLRHALKYCVLLRE